MHLRLWQALSHKRRKKPYPQKPVAKTAECYMMLQSRLFHRQSCSN
jgi:hypothetical protein